MHNKNISVTDPEELREHRSSESLKEEKKISRIFMTTLALISILGFISIISENVFGYSIGDYVEPLWLVIMGLGFVIETNPIDLFRQLRINLDESNFNRITSLVIGIIALVSGILTLPFFSFDHFMFSAMKGLISAVAIIFIVIETWVLQK